MNQPPNPFVVLAVEAALLSPCQSKRGVVIFRGDYVISRGYNYKPRGFACDGSDACKSTCRIEAVHAEQHALLQAGLAACGADLVHVKSVDGRLVPSGDPSCVQCSKLILAVGIDGVWLFHEDGWQRYDAERFHRLSLRSNRDKTAPNLMVCMHGCNQTYGEPPTTETQRTCSHRWQSVSA